MRHICFYYSRKFSSDNNLKKLTIKTRNVKNQKAFEIYLAK